VTGGRRGRLWPSPAPALVVIGVALIIGAVVTATSTEGLAGALVTALLALGGAFALVTAGVVTLLPRVVRFVVTHVARAKGIAMIDTMPPGDVMHRLLERVLGDHEANEHIAQSLIGGTGRYAGGRDLSLAGSTHVHYELGAAEPGTYTLTSTVTYSFPRRVTDLTMTLFTTSDARLRDIIVAACERPLFDWTYVSDAEQWRSSDEEPVVDLAIRFVDAAGRERSTELESVVPAWVPLDDWPEHLSLFRRTVRSRPPQNPRDYVNSLRVHTIDLAALAPRGFAPVAISGLTLRQRSTQPDSGNVFWQPPFPCLLQDVTIDASAFAELNGVPREFNIQPFLTGTAVVVEPKNWAKADEISVLEVGTWALPGHGFIVLWRAASERTDGKR
jgi:hypothetical protein